jgi:FtsP/CotA-like multicopper oxidase with cupredoxin domain
MDDRHHLRREEPAPRPIEHFSREVEGLPPSRSQETLTVSPFGSVELTAAPVRRRLGAADLRMLACNGSVPGPLLRVKQDSEITVRFTNQTELDTTVHWHGLRHDYLYDGVPAIGHHRGVQPPVRPREDCIYKLRFPDPGGFWYHPHLREDYTQELGLYGPIIVEPADPSYWPRAHRDLSLVVDDLLVEEDAIAPFRREGSTHTAMGRFGNVMLVNGEEAPRLPVRRGEVVRLYLLNTANTRVFRLALPGARLKLVGSDVGRVEREVMKDRLTIAPSERWVVDAWFPEAGELILQHVSDGITYDLATFAVSEEQVDVDLSDDFLHLRHNPEFARERALFEADRQRAPDRIMVLQGEMPGMSGGHDAGHEAQAGHETAAPLIEWEDTMPDHNAMSTPETMAWHISDERTGARDHGIHWVFRRGDRVKVRIVNDPASDHPMHHPVHFHGERFYELEWEGRPADSIMWKDTVLVPTGKTVDILLDCSNPGLWMVHCHIAEHLEAGMMFTFEVRDAEDERLAG